ncbi:MAG: manganese catalase family protein [Clostridia bacterium]
MEYIKLKEMLEANKQLPFPKLQNIKKSTNYAKMLYEDFAGNLGELSAITQYVYEHIQIENQDISRLLLQIAIQEMKHMEVIGSLIKQLGLEPKYVNSLGETWSAHNVRYKTGTRKETMLYNAELEKEAIMGYKKAMMHTRNQSIRATLNRIILDEEIHLKVFQDLANWKE